MASAQIQTRRKMKPLALVLVVDDENAICSSLAGVLRDENYEVICASDGVEALNKVEEFKPDLVFLDIWMPGWDGIETLERIKQASPNTEVIMISGHATIANALEAMKRGAFDLIEKPFTIESVVSAATMALDRKRRTVLALTAENGRGVEDRQLAAAKSTTLYSHRGLLSTGLRGNNIGQRTLCDSVILYGQGLHSGVKSGLVLEPLPINSGIHFTQMGGSETVPVFVDYVQSTGFATSIRSGMTVAATIEHLMAVLHAYRISNLLIKCNGEVPIFDGSAQQFCKAIESIGVEEQGGDWYELAVDRTITIHGENPDSREVLTIEPADVFSVAYELNYPPPVGRQTASFILDGAESFRNQVAPARTFGFMRDVEKLQKAGLAAGGRLDNFILIGEDKVVNTELRFSNELARHKILDIIGDMFLIGRPMRAAVRASMTGHSDNIKLLKQVKELLDQV
jgi:UDP-3-O-[3-hydroxymyristoyl] N-acetylglucosamine deacetylase